jgi:hypothetical protein
MASIRQRRSPKAAQSRSSSGDVRQELILDTDNLVFDVR